MNSSEDLNADGAISRCQTAASTIDRNSICRRKNQLKRRESHRHRLKLSSQRIILVLCSVFICSCICKRSNAFSITPPSTHQSRPVPSRFLFNTHPQPQILYSSRSTRFYMSAILEPPSQSSPVTASRMSDFQQRMKGIVKRNGGRKMVGTSRSAAERPANLRTVHTLEEYKDALDASSGKMVVVRFFATWCKACKAIQPSFYRMASLYPHVTFLEIPVTNHNANLHQGLEVPSLPYGHIYYPEAGLVEEMKISKKYFHGLVKMVRWYDDGSCGIDEFVPESEDTDEKDK